MLSNTAVPGELPTPDDGCVPVPQHDVDGEDVGLEVVDGGEGHGHGLHLAQQVQEAVLVLPLLRGVAHTAGDGLGQQVDLLCKDDSWLQSVP